MRTIAMFLYPYLATKLNLNSEEFGIIAGTSVHSVPQAIATGLIFSEQAGDRATIIKLVRVLLLCPMIVFYLLSQKIKA